MATNGHVIEGATDITVQVGEDERVYRATLVGHDEATDLALLKVVGDKPFPVLPLGESEKLEVASARLQRDTSQKMHELERVVQNEWSALREVHEEPIRQLRERAGLHFRQGARLEPRLLDVQYPHPHRTLVPLR